MEIIEDKEYGWLTEIHVHPTLDLKEHKLSKACWCDPIIENGGEIIIHQSADKRELFEQKERLPS